MNRKFLAAVILVGMVVLISLLELTKTDSAVMASDEVMVEASAAQEVPHAVENPFEAYTYYMAENLDRYADYQADLPDLDAATVVWHVNAGLDIEPYTFAVEAAGDYPLLVNKRHKLPENYEPVELEVIHGSVMATPGTVEAFRRMRTAAMQDGMFIEAAAGYRSIETQREMFEQQERYLGTEAAEAVVERPGYGEHSTGRALHIVDRDYSFNDFDLMPEYIWLTQNCADYGFILRYAEDTQAVTGFAYEPYHFTFVGTEIALSMKGQGIATLEEYVGRGMAPAGDVPIDDRTAVVILAGFGGNGDNSYENNMAQCIKSHLAAENMRVVIAQNGEDVANETKAAVMIGIDRVSAEGVGGAVAWFASDRPESGGLAETIDSRISWAGLPIESRGIYADSKIALTRLTEAPAVLIEVTDAWMGDDYSERMSKPIADAVIAYLEIRKMYLTFDDGPSVQNTPAVLEILREKGVKATFFVVGEMAEANPDLLREIVAEGHTIGIHCYNHGYDQLYESVESFIDDFNRAREVVRDITGLEPVIYRFPGGSINNYNREVYVQIIEEMDRRGFVYYDWNITSDDALGSVQAGNLMNTITEQPRPRNAVLLMHDAYPNIAAELRDIIDYFSDYQIAVLTEETIPVQF